MRTRVYPEGQLPRIKVLRTRVYPEGQLSRIGGSSYYLVLVVFLHFYPLTNQILQKNCCKVQTDGFVVYCNQIK